MERRHAIATKPGNSHLGLLLRSSDQKWAFSSVGQQDDRGLREQPGLRTKKPSLVTP